MTLTTDIGNEVQGCHHKIMQWKPQSDIQEWTID